MTEKIKNIVVTSVMAVLLFGITLFAWFKPVDIFSDSERRELAKMPALNAETIFNKDRDKTFMKLFEDYTLDQFPLRDTFRTLKSYVAFNVFGHKDNNNLYVHDGYIAQIQYPLDKDSITNATDKISGIYDKYFKDSGANVYLSIIPDKGYYLAGENGYLSLDYEELFALVLENTDFAEYIDITGSLTYEDYYKTDTHWRQENITDVADKLMSAMGTSVSGDYTVNTLEHPFYGVYHGQLALPLPAEQIKYLTSDVLNECIIKIPNKAGFGLTEVPLYNMDNAVGKDPYEMFLSGARVSIVTIENPNATSDRELIVFRDSFGSSLIPLLAEGYSKITAVDIREISPHMLQNNGVDVENADDILFIYSTLIINNSAELK
ncbi:MAG: hypothetical protein IKV39_01225 [Clostridia bacterium]|nr:hypothetical protein [Clostridia bacterium]